VPHPPEPASLLPLQGVRILDLTQLLPGPAATLLLAQMGATVVKVEPPTGDPARFMGGARQRTSQAFVALQRGKQVVTLDLKQDAGRRQLLDMAGSADALLEGFRPGVMQRLGLGWETLHRHNPRLVMCSITGYGQQGPYADRAGHDVNYLGYAGALDQMAGRDGRPALSGLPVADMLGGAQTAAMGVLAALLAGRQTGKGSHVDVSMTAAVFAANILAAASANLDEPPPAAGNGLLTGGAPCYNTYRTADGRFMAVGALEHHFWKRVCRVLGRDDLADSHWQKGQAPGSTAARALRDELQQIFGGKTQAQWVAEFEKSDCCVTPVLDMAEAMSHPMFTQAGMVQDCDDPIEGRSRFPAAALRFRP